MSVINSGPIHIKVESHVKASAVVIETVKVLTKIKKIPLFLLIVVGTSSNFIPYEKLGWIGIIISFLFSCIAVFLGFIIATNYIRIKK